MDRFPWMHPWFHTIFLGSYFSITPRGAAATEAGYLFHKILFGAHNIDTWRTHAFNEFPPILKLAEWRNKELPVFKDQIERGDFYVFAQFNEH